MDQPSGPVHWSTTSCCRPLEQSHLLQTEPSPPLRGDSRQTDCAAASFRVAPLARFSRQRRVATSRARVALYNRAQRAPGFDLWAHNRSGSTRVASRVVVVRTYQAFFTPTSTNHSHTHTHTPSSSSYPSPHPTHYMSENQDAMKFKQGTGPAWRSQARCEPMEETANGYLEIANFKSAFAGSISDRLFHAMQPVS